MPIQEKKVNTSVQFIDENRLMRNYLSAALCTILVNGCSSGSSTPDDTEVITEDTVLTGVFIDSAVEGLSFVTATQSGETNELGEFQYIDGENITFSINDLVFPTVSASETITPLDMTDSGSIYEDFVVNTIVLLQSLDVDADTSNGITISEQATANATSINFNVSPSVFSQDSNVINLVANSGSIDTNLVSTEEASRHFQNTLVNTGFLEGFSRLDYTNFLIGNTADFLEGSKIYYRDDGVKYSRRINGDEYEGMWWLDENGLMCEDLRGGLSTYCVADAQDFMFNRSATSTNLYNYSEVGFVSRLQITEGNSLGLTGPQ